MPLDDALLVARARTGDADAYSALLGRHRERLVRACGRALAEENEAADVAQEAALVAWLQLDRLREPARFGAWLAAIGRNLPLVVLRDGAGTRETVTAEAPRLAGAGPAADDPAERVIARERAAELAA